MMLTPEQQQRILAVFEQRTQALFAGSCPLCRHKAWTLADGIIRLNIGPVYASGQFPAEMPCVALVCSNCGHTEMLNLISLGLGDMVGLAPTAVAGA